MPMMQRVSVVGNAGSGKSTLAKRLAAGLGVPYVELDAIHHLPNWEPIEPTAFQRAVGDIAATESWVIDGNYRSVVVDGPVWERADTVVWLDFPRRQVMRQVVGRTLRRLVTREELWNGNREPISNVVSWDPQKSVIRWAWTRHAKYQERFSSAMSSPQLAHLEFVRLTSRERVEAWLAATLERQAQ